MIDWEKAQKDSKERRTRRRVEEEPIKSYNLDQKPVAPKKEKKKRGIFSFDKKSKKKVIKKRKIKRILSNRSRALIAFFSALILISFLWLSPFNRVNTISVSATSFTPKDEILWESQLRPGMTWVTIMQQQPKVKQRLEKKMKTIRNISLKRQKNREIEIQVLEYSPIAFYKQGDEIKLLLTNQTILNRQNPSRTKGLPELMKVNTLQAKSITKALAQVPEKVRQEIESITPQNGNQTENLQVALKMRDGNIVVGTTLTLPSRLRYYEQILEELDGKQGVINLEEGAYYAPRTPGNDPFAPSSEKESYSMMIENERKLASSLSASLSSSLESMSETSSSEEEQLSSLPQENGGE